MSIITRRFVIGLSVFLAFLAGCYLGVNLVLLDTMKKFFRDSSDTGYFAAIMSLGTLEALERGDVEGAKRVLAQNVSMYCRLDTPEADPARKAKLRLQAEKVSAHSPALKEQLAKPPP